MDNPGAEGHPSGARLWLLLFRAFRQVEKIDRDSVRELGFRCITDFAVLEILLHQGPLSVSAIGERVLLTSGSVTTAIDRAEADGWVRRQTAEHDRRSVRVSLTEAGRQRIEEAYYKHAARLESGFVHLSSSERKELSQLLLKVARHTPES